MTTYKLGKSRDVTKNSIEQWNYYLAGEEIYTEGQRFDSLETLAKDTVKRTLEKGLNISTLLVRKYDGGSVHCPSGFVQHTNVTNDEMTLFLQYFLRHYEELKNKPMETVPVK